MSTWGNNDSGWGGGGTATADSGWGTNDNAGDQGWGTDAAANGNGGDSLGMENMDIGAGDGDHNAGGDRGCFNCGETG